MHTSSCILSNGLCSNVCVLADLQVQELASQTKAFASVLRQLQKVCSWHSSCQCDNLMADGPVLPKPEQVNVCATAC